MSRILGFPRVGPRHDAVAEAALDQVDGARRVRTLLRAVERVSGVGHWHLDLRIDALTWSDEVYRMHGLERGRFFPTRARAGALCHEADRGRVARLLESVVREGEAVSFEMRILRHDGAVRILQCNAEAEQDLRGDVMGVLGTFVDVTEERALHLRLEQQAATLRAEIARRTELEEELRRQALTDELTGIANRRHFLTRARMELARSDRYLQPLAVIAFDLDRFKLINDTRGHAAGDQVIRDVVDALGAMLRDGGDLLGRLGGEEFAVLLPQTDADDAEALAERMRATVAALDIRREGARIPVTASFGVVQAHQGEADVDALLNRADEVLYRAKSEGRDRVCRG